MLSTFYRRVPLAFAFVALFALPRTLAAQADVVEFEGTVLESHDPGFACGQLAVAGWATLQITRAIAGTLPPGNVRVVFPCTSVRVGERLHVRGVRIAANATHFRIYSIRPPLPRDPLVTIGARSFRPMP